MDKDLIENDKDKGISEAFSGDVFSSFSKFTSLLPSLLHFSVFLGVLISWCYFSFYVDALPSFASLGDATGYMLFIVLWSALISAMIIVVSFFPAFALKDTFLTHGNDSDEAIYFSIGYFIILPLIASVAFFIFNDLVKEHIGLFMFLMMVLLPIIIAYKVSSGSSMKERFFNSFSKIGTFIFYSFASTFAVLIFLETQILMLFLILFVIIISVIILKENKINIKIILGLSAAFLSVFSTILSMSEIDNPIIVKPFELLKLGHYKAELHFKDEFLKREPFIFNENNLTYATFFILSSVGDEYILKETRPSIKASVFGPSIHSFIVQGVNNPYFYEDIKTDIRISNNKSEFIIVDVNTSIKAIADKLRENGKVSDQKVYTIKKDDVAYRIVGKQVDNSYTTWLIND